VVEGLPISACFGVSRPCEDNNRTARRRKALHRREYAGSYGAVALVVCLVLLLCAMPVNVAFADESRNTPGQMTVTDNITDTQNLLGDNVGAVTDAIKKTKKESGVDVRLLYVDTFGDVSNPERWASDVLESTKPAPNTVMLAIASGDGNLVVVVSPKSDEWLSSKKTADELSKAALDPLDFQGYARLVRLRHRDDESARHAQPDFDIERNLAHRRGPDDCDSRGVAGRGRHSDAAAPATRRRRHCRRCGRRRIDAIDADRWHGSSRRSS
jgi:hypothetical protein